jgi:hypothetical protein
VYFPAITGKLSGWQVSENDTVVTEGSDYFTVLRPGSFENIRSGGGLQNNTWRVRTLLFMRFNEYDTLWSTYRAFRSDIIALPDTSPLINYGIQNQVFSASDEAGYLRDADGNYTGFVQQTLECAITQRVIVPRAY